MEKKDFSLKVIELNETFDDELMSHVMGGGTDDFCPCLFGTKCECNTANSKVVTPSTSTTEEVKSALQA